VGNTKMPGWKLLRECNGFNIYENENYVPMGFAFGSYITQEEFERVKSVNRSAAILNALVLSREQMKKYSDITGYFDKPYYMLYGGHPETFKSEADTYAYGSGVLKAQAKYLNEHACSSFAYTKTGFEAAFNNKGKGDTLLFFSVPYSDGFSATVNGEPVDIEKVDYGFMAVRVPGNTKSKIVFKYNIYGFDIGIIITSACGIMFFMYAALLMIFGRKKRRR
jgi:uncharacterized membrane protein YfhO